MLTRLPWTTIVITVFCICSTAHCKTVSRKSKRDICSFCKCKHQARWSLFECRSKTMSRIPYVDIRKKKPDGISFHLWLPLLKKVQRSDFNRRFEVTDLVIDGASRELHLTGNAFDAISESLQRLSIQFPMTFVPETALTFPFLWSLRFLEYFKVVRTEGSSEEKVKVNESLAQEDDLKNTDVDGSHTQMIRREAPVFSEKNNTDLAYKSSDGKKHASKKNERGSDDGTTTQKMTTVSAPVLNAILKDAQHFLLASGPPDGLELANSSDRESKKNENNNDNSNDNNNDNNNDKYNEDNNEDITNQVWTSGRTDQPGSQFPLTDTTTTTDNSENTDHLLTLNREVIMSGSTFQGPAPLVLRELYIENLGITAIQWDTFLNFVALKALGLSKNRVKDVPFVRNLLELTELTMDHNDLYHVDADVSFPLALQRLDFSHNALSWIQLDATPSLRWLDLSFNEGLRFESFWISEDTNLESLNVSYTGLDDDDAMSSVSLAAMKSLQFLGTRMPCTCQLKLIRDAVPEVVGTCALPSGELPQVWTVSAEDLMKRNASKCEVKAGGNKSVELEKLEGIDNLGRLERTNGARPDLSAAAPCLGMRQLSWLCFLAVHILLME